MLYTFLIYYALLLQNWSLLSFANNTPYGIPYNLFIPQELHRNHRFEILIQVINKRNMSGQIE